jgi:hypothetical protein
MDMCAAAARFGAAVEPPGLPHARAHARFEGQAACPEILARASGHGPYCGGQADQPEGGSDVTERRYRQEEVRRIFELATTSATQSPLRPADGLTLDEIQEIAGEIGVEPAAVARAAAAVDSEAATRVRRLAGQPIGVARVIPLPRAPTDREWEQLVGELRTAFRARGRVVSQGGLREWSNGNLHACVEATDAGYQLRLGTVKGDATGLNAIGVTALLAGIATFGSLLMSGEPGQAMFVSSLFGAAGAGTLIANAVRLPRWARQRQDQMAHIAQRAAQIVSDTEPAAPSLPPDQTSKT